MTEGRRPWIARQAGTAVEAKPALGAKLTTAFCGLRSPADLVQFPIDGPRGYS